MKKRNYINFKVGAAMLAATMAMTPVVPAMAAGTNYSATIGGTPTTSFQKYLVMDQQAEVPNASFTYAVTAGTAKSYDLDGKTFEVLAGVDADKVTMAGVGTTTANTITYKQGDATKNDEGTYVKNYDDSTEKYAEKTATLDFSACKFTEPGVYRYVITESGTNQAITNDADLTRTLDVYVEDDSDENGKKLKIAGYVLHSNEDDTIETGDDFGTNVNATLENKSQGFTNEYTTSDLTFRKEVTGNQASKDKYFEFTVTIANATPGTVYDVDIANADGQSIANTATIEANKGKTNVTSLTVDENGKVEQKFYLQHGQQIEIQGIAEDTTYTVTENAEDYKSTANAADASVVTIQDGTDSAPTQGTIADKDLTTGYLNTRSGVIPTGVLMTVAPFAAVTLLGGFGAATIMMKKKREDEE